MAKQDARDRRREYIERADAAEKPARRLLTSGHIPLTSAPGPYDLWLHLRAGHRPARRVRTTQIEPPANAPTTNTDMESRNSAGHNVIRTLIYPFTKTPRTLGGSNFRPTRGPLLAGIFFIGGY